MSTEILSEREVRAGLKSEAAVVEAWLASCLRRENVPPGLVKAMEYSLLAGGKRIRPVLCLLSARLCGLDPAAILPFAGALECIHTYSLIHDDLPAMDDDDLRRGRPSNHKRFDEATAILAGDGLLTDAFALMASVAEPHILAGELAQLDIVPEDQALDTAAKVLRAPAVNIPASRALRAIILVAEAAGSPGMVGGQYLDMQYTARSDVTLEELAAMHAMKTGAMLRVACEAGAVLAGADREELDALTAYGTAVGAAFQITDDILDETGDEATLGKPVGSDAARNKCTYPSLLGLEKSRDLAAAHAEKATRALQGYTGSAAALLRGLAAYIVNRVS